MDVNIFQNIIDEIDRYKPTENSCDNEQFYKNFVSTTTIDRFVILVENILAQQQKSLKQNKLIKALSECIYSKEYFENLLYSTIDEKSMPLINKNQFLLTKFINILISLPELISNLNQTDFLDIFSIKSYIPRLCFVILQVLKRLYSNDSNTFSLDHISLIIGRLCLKGYSQIVWDNLMFAIFNYPLEDQKWKLLLQHIILDKMKFNIDSNKKFISSDQCLYVEPILKMIFSNATSHKSIEVILDCKNIETSVLMKMEFLLCNKFLLIFHFIPNFNQSNPDQFIFNIFNFMYSNKFEWLVTSINNVLDTWSNSNAFNFRSYIQHYYLCRLMIISCKMIFQLIPSSEKTKTLVNKFRKVVIFGTQTHLSTTQSEFRVIGLTSTLIMLDIINKSSLINIDLPKFDELESTKNEDCMYLRKLGIVCIKDVYEHIPTDKTKENSKMINLNVRLENIKHEKIQAKVQHLNKSQLNKELDSDDDEDDDLVPYDMPNDVAIEDDIRYSGKDIETVSSKNNIENIQSVLLIDPSKQTPIYLEDCIEGLLEYDKPAWMEKCLQVCEKIIRANYFPNSKSTTDFSKLDNSALRLAQVLFNLDDKLSVDNFEILRKNSLIALCVGSPKIVASYLSQQFYAPYLSVRNRLDVLAILSAASEELSELNLNNKIENNQNNLANVDSDKSISNSKAKMSFQKKYFGINNYYKINNEEDSDDEPSEDWRKIVENRIQSNTKYISPYYLKKQFETSVNEKLKTSRFAPVAGYFFFPLLRDPNKTEIKLNFKSEDSFVLEHLILTLGVLLKNCANYPQVKLMSKELLEFLATNRNHEHSNVRLAIIATFYTIIISTPHFYLFNELLSQVLEFQLWLKEIFLKDVDSTCREHAYQTLCVLSDKGKTSEQNCTELETKHFSKENQKANLSSEDRTVQYKSLDFNSMLKIVKQI